jgi:hypothetical protein
MKGREDPIGQEAAMANAGFAPTPLTSVDAAPWPRWRILAIRIWAGLLTGVALVMAQGVVLIAEAAPDERFMYATSTVWKLLSLGAVGVVMWTGGRRVAAYWAIGVGQLVWLVAGLIAPAPDANGILLGLVNTLIFFGPLVLLRPRRRQLLHPAFRPDSVLLTLAIAGAVPLVWFALSVHAKVSGELGFDMLGLYLILAAVGILAALRPWGAEWLPAVASAAAALTGFAALARPVDQASPGVGGGLLLMSCAGAFLLLARRRQCP